MEAIERWTAHYPELEALSQALKGLHTSVCAIGEPGEAPSAHEVRAKVGSEVGEFQELVEALAPEADRLRPELASVPLSSLTALYVQLQSELQRCPEQSRSIGGPPLCESLREVLDSTGRTASPVANDLLEAWVQEFLREPLEELYVHNGQALQFVQNSTATEQGLTRRIQELSEQICQRGFRPDRVELMDKRSVLVQQLLTSLGSKQRSAAGSEPKIEGLLRGKLQAFEEAHAASLKERRDEIARHAAISETLDRNVESLGRYVRQKERAREAEDSAAAAQREQRAAKVSRVAEVFQEAFAGVLAIIEECRRDSMQRMKVQMEERVAAEVGEEFARRLRHFRDLHAAASTHAERSLGLEVRFAGWLRQAFVAMEDKANQVVGDLRSHVSSSRARMLALSGAGTAQVRAQREQMQQVVELTSKELGSCQETLALMEFSRPSNAEVAKSLRRFEQVQESARWQQREVERLAEIEQRIRQDADSLVVEAVPLEGELSNEERWSRLLSEAEAWVAGFFYTWKRDVPALGQPKADETDQQELSLSAFAVDSSRRAWRSPPTKQTPESTEGSAPLRERQLPGETKPGGEVMQCGLGSGRAWRVDSTQASVAHCSASASACPPGGREQVGGSRSSAAGCSRVTHDSPSSGAVAAASAVATYGGETGYGVTSEMGSPVKLTLSEISQCVSEGSSSTNTTAGVSLVALSVDPVATREGTGSVIIPAGSMITDLATGTRALEVGASAAAIAACRTCSDAETEVASTPSTQLAASGVASPSAPSVPSGTALRGVCAGAPAAAAVQAPAMASIGQAAPPRFYSGHRPVDSAAGASASPWAAVAGGSAVVAVSQDAARSRPSSVSAPLSSEGGRPMQPLCTSARGYGGARATSAITPSWPSGAGRAASFCPPSSSSQACAAALLEPAGALGHPGALAPGLHGPACVAGPQAWLRAASPCGSASGSSAPSRPSSVPPGRRRAAQSPRGGVAFVPVEVVCAGRERAPPPVLLALQPPGGPLATGPLVGGNPLLGSSLAIPSLSRCSSMGSSVRAFSAADLHQRVRPGGLSRMTSVGELLH